MVELVLAVVGGGLAFGAGVLVARWMAARGLAPQPFQLERRSEPQGDGPMTTLQAQAAFLAENARLAQELRDTLEYQAATSEVLKVISRSTFELDSLLTTLAETAGRLCNANAVRLYRRDGDALVVAASHNHDPRFELLLTRRPIDRGSVAGRAALECRVVHVLNVLDDPEHVGKDEARIGGVRTVLAVPLLREGELIGVISLTRTHIEAFSKREVDLVTVFADQAVIAIENARLVQALRSRTAELDKSIEDLRDALEFQTATSDVLKVISRSAFDLDSVLATLVETAARLCNAPMGHVLRLEGEHLHLGATTRGYDPELARATGDMAFTTDRGSLAGRVALDRRAVHVIDAWTDPEYKPQHIVRAGNVHSMLGVPLLREGQLIGVIALLRTQIEAFSQREIDLVTVFADQAVIAIENARLVQELETRNRDLGEALEQQTATSEILRVISSSPGDVGPVLTMVAETAARLCDANNAFVVQRENGVLRMVATYGEFAPISYPAEGLPVDRDTVTGRAVFDRTTVHVSDLTSADSEFPVGSNMARRGGHRTNLATPLLRNGIALGAINIRREEVRPFSARQIKLLETFADHAVIAIENARLLREIQTRTEALAQSVEELRTLGETGQAVVATLDLAQVLDTVMHGAIELGGAKAGSIFRYSRTLGEFSLWRAYGLPDAYAVGLHAMRIPAAQSIMGAAMRDKTLRALDIDAAPLLPLREATAAAGFGHVLVVPLIRGERAFGSMVLYYRDAASVPERALDLMQTFASQSVVAIQNARLFREIAEQSRQLEVASQHKSQFLANMSHELRTPMNAILGYTELMLDGLFGDLNADMKDTLERVQHNGKHLLSLINDVLDLSKIEAGRFDLTFAEYDVNAVVQSVMATARPLAEAKHIELAAEVAADLPICVGDERRLTQVLLNLVGNAVKFTDHGSVHIGVTRRDGSIEYAVKDTGPGIDPADQDRIFGEFQQADSSITREKGGTGLGLAISRRIVEMHGGTISVESARGHGATFRAVVPLRAAEETAA